MIIANLQAFSKPKRKYICLEILLRNAETPQKTPELRQVAAKPTKRMFYPKILVSIDGNGRQSLRKNRQETTSHQAYSPFNRYPSTLGKIDLSKYKLAV